MASAEARLHARLGRNSPRLVELCYRLPLLCDCNLLVDPQCCRPLFAGLLGAIVVGSTGIYLVKGILHGRVIVEDVIQVVLVFGRVMRSYSGRWHVWSSFDFGRKNARLYVCGRRDGRCCSAMNVDGETKLLQCDECAIEAAGSRKKCLSVAIRVSHREDASRLAAVSVKLDSAIEVDQERRAAQRRTLATPTQTTKTGTSPQARHLDCTPSTWSRCRLLLLYTASPLTARQLRPLRLANSPRNKRRGARRRYHRLRIDIA